MLCFFDGFFPDVDPMFSIFFHSDISPPCLINVNISLAASIIARYRLNFE